MFQITQVKKHERVVSSRWMMMKMMMEKDENGLKGEPRIDLLHLRSIQG